MRSARHVIPDGRNELSPTEPLNLEDANISPEREDWHVDAIVAYFMR
jgi:hypothetical protein